MRNIILIVFSACLISSCKVKSIEAVEPSRIPVTLLESVTGTPPTLLPESNATATPFPTLTLGVEPPEADGCGNLPGGHSVYLDDYPVFAVRQGPGCAYEALEGPFVKPYPGALFEVIGSHGNWLLVDLCNQKQGWAFASAVAWLNIDTNLELPEITPPPTPVGSRLFPPGEGTEAAIDRARETLVSFFDHLYNKNYAEAVKLFAGGYGPAVSWNPDVDPHDYATLLMRACEWNGFQCFLRISKVFEGYQISPMEYLFGVEFVLEDGSLYQRRGINDTVITQFHLRVARNCEGDYFVVEWPFYEQYGG